MPPLVSHPASFCTVQQLFRRRSAFFAAFYLAPCASCADFAYFKCRFPLIFRSYFQAFVSFAAFTSGSTYPASILMYQLRRHPDTPINTGVGALVRQ